MNFREDHRYGGQTESMWKIYARMVYYAYVNDKEYEPIHLLFASGSINDAYTEIE